MDNLPQSHREAVLDRWEGHTEVVPPPPSMHSLYVLCLREKRCWAPGSLLRN